MSINSILEMAGLVKRDPAVGNEVVTDFHSGTGVITAIRLSPYWYEEQDGMVRYFVEAEGGEWADWLTDDEITVVS